MGTKETILRCAEELLRQKGYNEVSLREIADAAGVSVGNLTYYYPKKEKLVEAIFEARGGRAYTPEGLSSPAEFEAFFRHVLSVQRRSAFYFDSYIQLSQTSGYFRRKQEDRLGTLRKLFTDGLRTMARNGLIAPESARNDFSDRAETILTVLMLRLPGEERAGSSPEADEAVLRRLMALLGT